jgi:hypothetical protein
MAKLAAAVLFMAFGGAAYACLTASTFSRDIAYSERPAASRALSLSP